MTHNDLKIGDNVKLYAYSGVFTVTDILDGYRGISLTKTGDIHSKDRSFFDVDEIERKVK